MPISKRSNSQILYVPTVSRNSPEKELSQIIADLEELQKIPDYMLNLKIDFQKCEFLNHAGVAFLGGLIRLIEKRGGKVSIKLDTLLPQIKMNLAQNGFLHEFGDNRSPWTGNSIPFWSIRRCNQNAVVSYLSDKWLDRGWVNVSESLRNKIVGQVVEIYQNAFEHSQSPVGVFSCGQHYPNARWLHLAAVDFGVGIPAKVRSLPKNSRLSTEEAFEWAFREGTSTKSEFGVCRGMGLNLLQEFITVNQGILKIFSNDGYVVVNRRGVKYRYMSTNMSGTLVDIALQCNESYYCLDFEVIESGKLWF